MKKRCEGSRSFSLSFFLSLVLSLFFSPLSVLSIIAEKHGFVTTRRKASYVSNSSVIIDADRVDRDRFFREGRIWGRLRFDDARDLAKIEGCIAFHVALHPSSSIVSVSFAPSFSLLLFFPLFLSFLSPYMMSMVSKRAKTLANRRNYFLLLRARNNDHYITPACLTRRN